MFATIERGIRVWLARGLETKEGSKRASAPSLAQGSSDKKYQLEKPAAAAVTPGAKRVSKLLRKLVFDFVGGDRPAFWARFAARRCVLDFSWGSSV